jgi:hypothetical protein
MNCPCGCSNAEVCWRNCCCYSQQEKLAWARDHGVTPPAYAQVAPETLATAKQPACCCNLKSCCQSQARPECCGDAKLCNQSGSQNRSQRRRRPPTTSTLLLVDALRCQGLTSSLVALPPSILPRHGVQKHAAPPTGEAALRHVPLFQRALAAPDTPPPQRLA